MLWTLVKKQMAEVFKGYFYDAKKNRMRSKLTVALWFIFFVLLMVFGFGGIFAALSLTLCQTLYDLSLGWMYFLMMGMIAIMLGAFGSVFNTYASLYLAKDNDLLLSLPVPVQTIIASRLLNVWLMGALYSSLVFLPALIVYWSIAGITAARLICGLLMLVLITVIVLLLSTVLGWAVAKISLRLKNRSFTTVLASLVFIGLYYFVYFRANGMIQQLLLNAVVYGEKIKGAAYVLYLFGRIGEGDWLGAVAHLAVYALLCAAVWKVLTGSFLNIATSSGNTQRVAYVEKPVKQKSVFMALLDKEFRRFTSSANYMLNCGLGVLIMPAAGIALMIYGKTLLSSLDIVFESRPGTAAILLCAMMCMMSAMNDMAVPSVSLEGKSIWIPQSLPVSPKTVLRAKACVQLILTLIPMFIGSLFAVIYLNTSVSVKVLIVVTALVYAAFSCAAGMVIGVRMPLLNWTNEIAPIKQSGAVTLALFGSWALCTAFGGLYMLAGYKIGATAYLIICIVLFSAAGLILWRWLEQKGSRIFAEL